MVGGDFSMQPQSGGLLEQSQMLFGNGAGVNPRKRGREPIAGAGATPINLFALQHPPPPPTLINLAQLHNQAQQQQQPPVVSTGLRLSFEDQQPPPQSQQQQQQMGLLLPPSILSEDLQSQIKSQRDEIDQFLRAQGEELRRTLAERRHRHYRALLGAAEQSASRLLREKEAELERAARRNVELEERAANLKAEAHVWQSRARAQEAAAASLQSKLQQAMQGGCGAAHDRRGEEGGCAVGEADDAESAHIDPSRAEMQPPACRACGRRPVSVVMLPCRHLCVCLECESGTAACPICSTVRTASVEVYLS